MSIYKKSNNKNKKIRWGNKRNQKMVLVDTTHKKGKTHSAKEEDARHTTCIL